MSSNNASFIFRYNLQSRAHLKNGEMHDRNLEFVVTVSSKLFPLDKNVLVKCGMAQLIQDVIVSFVCSDSNLNFLFI